MEDKVPLCVCVCERERERETPHEYDPSLLWQSRTGWDGVRERERESKSEGVLR